MPRRSPDFIAAHSGGGTRLRVPPDLGPAERAVFVQLIGSQPASRFDQSDYPALELYCRCVVAEKLAFNELNAATGEDRGPRLREWAALARQVGVSARRLKINPAGRGETRASNEPAPATSAYAQMRIAETAFRDN